MPGNEGYRRYLEAAAVLGQITKARAEQVVREMVNGGQMQREQTQQWFEGLIERSRKATGDLLDLVRAEVSNQMQALGLDPDDLAHRAAEILRRSAEAGRRVVRDATDKDAEPRARPPTGGALQTSAKKTSVKKAAAKKTTARATAKEGTAKEGTAKAAASKKTTSGPAGATRKKAPGRASKRAGPGGSGPSR